jgi:hypothetical protein
MTALQSNFSPFQGQAKADLQSQVDDLISKLSTLYELGGMFLEDDSLCVPACVIKDYSGVCLEMLRQIEDSLCVSSPAFRSDCSDDCPPSDDSSDSWRVQP